LIGDNSLGWGYKWRYGLCDDPITYESLCDEDIKKVSYREYKAMFWARARFESDRDRREFGDFISYRSLSDLKKVTRGSCTKNEEYAAIFWARFDSDRRKKS